MRKNKVKRSRKYIKYNRKKYNALKITASVLSIIVLTSAALLIILPLINKPQTVSTSSLSGESIVKEESSAAEKEKTESSERPEDKPSRDPNLPDYSNSYKYTDNPIEADELNDEYIMSKYAVLYDAATDTVTYKKSAQKKCYPASTTKLLTAIVASKLLDEDKVITVGDEINMIGEDSSIAGLENGEKLTVKQLMYAMLLPSGNDAAYTLAVNAARTYKNDEKLSAKKSVAVFAELMNDAAKELGAENSHFKNPDGFHDVGHYSTALDLLKIANYAKDIPLISEICKTYQTIQLLENGEEITWNNSNKLLDENEYCYSEYAEGMKTGFTDEAGSCLIAIFTKDKSTQLIVAMDSSDTYDKYYDSLKLAKLGFNNDGIEFSYSEIPPDVE